MDFSLCSFITENERGGEIWKFKCNLAMPEQNNQMRNVLMLNGPSGDNNIHLIPALPYSVTLAWQKTSEYPLCSHTVFKDLRASAVWRQKARQGWPRIITTVQWWAKKHSLSRRLNKGCVCLSAFIRFISACASAHISTSWRRSDRQKADLSAL